MKKYWTLNNMRSLFTVYLLGLGLLASTSCQNGNGKSTAADSAIANTQDEKWDPIAPDTATMRKNYTCVEIITTEGKLEVALFDATPKHRDNFIKLVKSGYYKDLLFHRIKNEFMVQGGDPNSKNASPSTNLGQGGPGYTIPAEFRDTLYHYRGALAAARTSDEVNPEKQSSGSQFYIVTGAQYGTTALKNTMKDRAIISFLKNPDNLSYNLRLQTYQGRGDMAAMNVLMQELEAEVKPLLDSLYRSIPPRTRQMYATWGGFPALDKEYTIFGFLISGYDVLDKMQKVATNQQDRPETDVKILSARVLARPVATSSDAKKQ
jgi:cyclophilin family peptidyl-prolyl cis-trans isomerase